MRKRILVVLMGLLLVAQSCFAYDSYSYYGSEYSAFEKLKRGVINIVTSPIAIFRNIYTETQYNNIGTGMTVGLGKGLFETVARIGTGAVDTVTFPFNFPKEGREPILDPEYAWEDWY